VSSCRPWASTTTAATPFIKAHGAKNDFLLTWRRDAPDCEWGEFARAICNRYTGVGADGWMLVDKTPSIELYNSDGSKPELSGNGTRCAAAFLIEHGKATDTLTIQTGAGPKHLRLLRKDGPEYWFQMDMGSPVFGDGIQIEGMEASVVNVGNPQCAVVVNDFDFDWRGMGKQIEHDPQFPNRTNVSFLRPVGANEIEVRFWERGAGETNSSGTGSTGAFAAAVQRGIVPRQGRVLTPAGPLELEWRDTILLTGPAEIVAEGTYRYEKMR